MDRRRTLALLHNSQVDFGSFSFDRPGRKAPVKLARVHMDSCMLESIHTESDTIATEFSRQAHGLQEIVCA